MEVNGQFGRKLNQDIDGNKKLFRKEVSKVNGGNVKSCSRIKDGNGRLAMGRMKYERSGRIILRNYITDTQKPVAVHVCGFDGIQRCNYFE